MNARVLRAEAGSGLQARLGEYLGPRDAARVACAFEMAAVVLDDAPQGAELVADAIRRGGGFARLDGERLVVAATRESIAHIAREFAETVVDRAGSAHAVLGELMRALEADRTQPAFLRLRDRTLDLAARPAIVGILNVTPDSFYDRGRYNGIDRARERAAELVALGADLIDIGGRSYSSALDPVDESEERRRVVPVVAALVRDGLDVALSIDTSHSAVAEASLEAGAHLINDCSGLKDARLPAVVARYDAALVVMHIEGELNVRETAYRYDDAMAQILDFLRVRLDRARAAGVRGDALVADPGLEFGKEPATDLEILARFAELGSLGVPSLLAASRKSFIGRVVGGTAKDLLVPSLAAAAAGIIAGASLIRVHDVAEAAALVAMLASLREPHRARLSAASAAGTRAGLRAEAP